MTHPAPRPRDPDLPWPGRDPENYGRHYDRPVPQGAAASAAVLLGIVVAAITFMILVLVWR